MLLKLYAWYSDSLLWDYLIEFARKTLQFVRIIPTVNQWRQALEGGKIKEIFVCLKIKKQNTGSVSFLVISFHL